MTSRERRVDVAIIGSGSAGTNVATAVAARGKSAIVIDDRPLGGTCALRGCDPKKVFVAAARVIDDVRRYGALGVITGEPHLQWDALQRFKRTFTDPVPEQRAKTYDDAGIAHVFGTARFEDEQTLRVGNERIHAQHIVVASGARERHVADGDDLLLTSEQFLDLEHLPPSLLFVGGGYIAFEFAHVAARAGSRVTVLHNDAHPLHGFDGDAVQRLLTTSAEAGIDVHLRTPVEYIGHDVRGIFVETSGAHAQTFVAHSGVLTAGRVANIDDLDLLAGNVERTPKGIRVNEFLQSVSNPHVYAAGDCADGGGVPLTPTAAYEGDIAATNILDGNTRRVDLHGLATIVYTMPPLASVGLSLDRARERGIDVDVHEGDMGTWYETRHVAAHTGYYKVLVDKTNGTIVGATIFGPHAEEQINVLALAIRTSLTAAAVGDALFAYPTASSDLSYFF